jgi:hypothetical protein
MDILSRAFARKRLSEVYSVIGMCGLSRSIGAQKNSLRRLRPGVHGLV